MKTNENVQFDSARRLSRPTVNDAYDVNVLNEMITKYYIKRFLVKNTIILILIC